MSNQPYYDEVAVGTEITPLIKSPTTQQLVKWAGASEDFNAIHYDKDIAEAQGLPGVIVHGLLKGSFLIQMLTDWAGDKGAVRKISIQHRGMNYPGRNLACKGKVTSKQAENGEHMVECEIWAENEKGEKTVTGTAKVALPSQN